MGNSSGAISKPFQGMGAVISGLNRGVGKAVDFGQRLGRKLGDMPVIGAPLKKIASVLPVKETIESIKNVNEKIGNLGTSITEAGKGYEKGWGEGLSRTKDIYTRGKDLYNTGKEEITKGRQNWSKEGLTTGALSKTGNPHLDRIMEGYKGLKGGTVGMGLRG